MNLRNLKGNMELLDQVYAQKSCAGFLEIMIHEQFYQKDYVDHIADFEKIVLECCKWAAERGYKGAFLQEVLENGAIN